MYKVIKKSSGYGVKSFSDVEKARAYAEQCCRANHNNDYAVFENKGGYYEEI